MTGTKKMAAVFAAMTLAAVIVGLDEIAAGRAGSAMLAGCGAGASFTISFVEWMLAERKGAN